jgi:putative Ca2+/H+ antiporter (TMEM165/GDT1 family)
MEAFLISTGVVAVAEIGDKTQLLAFMLASRFRRPVAVILGIFFATVANHLLAAWVGTLVAEWLGGPLLKAVLGLSFLAMAVWVLKPDDEEELPQQLSRMGAFLTTLAAFFLIEIGDKTQIATVALGARFSEVAIVTAGTTLGMMLADVPAVFIGEAAAHKVPLRLVHGTAAVMFAALGALALFDAGRGFFG